MPPEKTHRLLGPLADTQYDIDTRQAPRYGCPGRPVLRVLVRPRFESLVVGVRDISTKGAGLICERPIEPGSALAVLWDYGPPHLWRTLRATVARLSPGRHGGWIIGCAFADWLQPSDIEAFFGCDQKAAVANA